MRFRNLVLVIFFIGVASAQGNITNLVVNQPLPNFVAGQMVSTIFSFDYPDLSSVYSKQVEGMPLVFVVNISSSNSDYPVWKGDFELNGSLRSFDNFIYSDYEFDCFENNFSVNCPYCPFDVLNIPDGIYYCSDEKFFRLGMDSKNEATLNVLSDIALWPGSYNYSVGLFYPERNWTMLVVSPSMPDGKNGWYVSEPEFSLVNSEADKIYYQWDGDDIYLYSIPFGLENIPNLNPVTAGVLNLKWWANLSCELENKQSKILKIDLTNPEINDLWPAPDDVTYENRPTIYSYIDEVYAENSGINLSSVVIKVDGVVVNANVVGVGLDAKVSYLPTTNLSEGRHNVFVYAVDNAGRVGYEFWEFEVGEVEEFVLDIFSPVDGNSDSKKIGFNLTTSEEVLKIEYINYADNRPRWRTLCRNCEEYGFSRKKTKSFSDGLNNLGFRATGEDGQVVEENVSVLVDSKAPRISKTLPKRNGYTNGSGFYIKYTEENLVRLSVSYNSTENLSFENCSEIRNYKECWFDLNLSEHDGDEIEYWFEMEDIVGHVVSSRATRINVDTSAPVVENNDSFWQQGIGRYARYIYFDLNVSEENLDEISYLYVDSRNVMREKRLCTRLKNGVCEKRVSFKRGDKLIGVFVVDKAENSVFENVGIVVDY